MMDLFSDMARTIAPERGDRHGPLLPLLLVLSIVTGLVDAVSYLRLGHVFVANMTGNVVFLGASDLSAVASLVALIAFMAGALIASRVGIRFEHHRGHRLILSVAIKLLLVAMSTGVAVFADDQLTELARYVLIVLLALAMGVQNATARKLAVPDLTTTVLTLTITGLAADSRLAALLAMLLGAIVGGLLVLHVSIAAALGLTAGLLLLTGLAAYRVSNRTAPWTAPT